LRMQQSIATAATAGHAHSRAHASPDAQTEPGDSDQSASAETEAEVDALLDSLQSQGYLSDERFIESRVHARASRYGSLRIKQELAQHGLSLNGPAMEELKSQEFARAKIIWQRKFGVEPPNDPRAQAKQIRFMMARGFAAETIRKLLRSNDE
jgi:regulatory protein